MPARLHGWVRIQVPDLEYPFVVPSVGGTVDGLAIFGLTPADYEILDEYEDVAEGTYLRVEVGVDVLEPGVARTARAWVYAGPDPSGPAGIETGEGRSVETSEPCC